MATNDLDAPSPVEDSLVPRGPDARALRALPRPGRAQAGEAWEAFEDGEAPRPAVDATRVELHGKTTDAYTKELALRAERRLGIELVVTQGSYNAGGVPASAGTHDGGGALDFSTRGKRPAQIRRMVEALREAGFAAWYRSGGEWAGNEHIHAIAIGAPDLSASAREQVRSYADGGDGLGEGADPHASAGRPMPGWARALLDRPTRPLPAIALR